MDQEFKFLKTAAMIFKVLAWISAAFFLIVTVIVFLGMGGDGTPRPVGIIFFIGGALYFLLLFTISEVIRAIIGLHGSVKDLSDNCGSGQGADVLTKKVERILTLLEGKPANK